MVSVGLLACLSGLVIADKPQGRFINAGAQMATSELESLKIHGNVTQFLKKQEALKGNLLQVISKKQEEAASFCGKCHGVAINHKTCASLLSRSFVRLHSC